LSIAGRKPEDVWASLIEGDSGRDQIAICKSCIARASDLAPMRCERATFAVIENPAIESDRDAVRSWRSGTGSDTGRIILGG
jgi:hypothetical protein